MKQLSGRSAEEINERIRDPPPPANFPVICPNNPKLRNIIERIDRDMFQKNGLHNIPYRDSRFKNKPTPVYDGHTWPESATIQETPIVETTGTDVIDIWTQREKERVLAEETRITYYDMPHNSLQRLIRAIEYPVEMRLLPHIIREWHRQGLPITLIDANRIARLATRHNEVDVVFQMINPEIYGLYYDMGGIREVTRGMAKRASKAPGDEEEKFTPEDMLNRVPLLLNCAVADAAKQITRDPAVLGTQLWGFVARFNNDQTVRTPKFVAEICGLAVRVIQCLSEVELHTSLSSERLLPIRERRELPFTTKFKIEDYTPVLFALRQLVAIIQSPYRACQLAFKRVNTSEEKIQQTRTYLNEFLNSRLSTQHLLWQHPTASGSSNLLKWAILNQGLGTAIERGIIHLPNMAEWQWFLLKQYTVPATKQSTTATNNKLYCLPLSATAALESLRKETAVWQERLKKRNISVHSEFMMHIKSYSPR